MLPGSKSKTMEKPKSAVSMRSIVLAAKEQLSCDLQGEAAILNLQTGVYFGLDPVGAEIWRMIRQPRTLAELRDAIVERYDVDAGVCESDILALIQKMEAAGLLRVLDGTPA